VSNKQMIRSKYIILTLFILVVTGCDQKISPDSNLVGTWTWISSSGGFAGSIETPMSSGEDIRIEFTKSRFKKYVNGVLTEDLRYSIRLDESIFSTEKMEIIKFSNGWKQSYSTMSDTLLLNDECFDCYQSVYKRD